MEFTQTVWVKKKRKQKNGTQNSQKERYYKLNIQRIWAALCRVDGSYSQSEYYVNIDKPRRSLISKHLWI